MHCQAAFDHFESDQDGLRVAYQIIEGPRRFSAFKSLLRTYWGHFAATDVRSNLGGHHVVVERSLGLAHGREKSYYMVAGVYFCVLPVVPFFAFLVVVPSQPHPHKRIDIGTAQHVHVF